MTRTRVLFLTALVAIALAINFDRLSLRIAQSEEDAVHARLTAASTALRAQIELRDAKLSPRLAASSPDLLDALRPPADPTLPVPKPDDKALRAAAAALQPTEPDLLIVATSDGAAYSRRGKPMAMTEEVKDLPLVKSALDGANVPVQFVQFDGGWFRVQSARIPGSVGVVVVGMLIDDRLASDLGSESDASVTFVREGNILASSLAEPARAELLAWTRAPELGYGNIALRIPAIGTALDGVLPRGAPHYAVRATRAPFQSGVMAVLTFSANQYFGWLGRYEGFYLIGLIVFILFGLTWGLLPGGKQRKAAPSAPVRDPLPSISNKVSRAEATLAGANDSGVKPAPPGELPWTEGDAGWGNLGQSARPPKGPRPESLDTKPPAGAAAPVIDKPLEKENKSDAPESGAGKQAEKVEGAPAASATSSSEGAPSSSLPPPPPPESVRLPAPGAASDAPAAASDSLASSDSPAAPSAPPPSPAADRDLFALDMPSMSKGPTGTDPGGPMRLVERAAEEKKSDVAAALAGDGWGSNDPFEARPPAAAIASAPGEFSFGSLLNEPSPEPQVTPPSRPLGLDEPEFTRPNAPNPSLLARTRGDDESVFPGDEPTRIEAVSAALLDKMREKDEPEPEPQADWGTSAAKTPPFAMPPPAQSDYPSSDFPSGTDSAHAEAAPPLSEPPAPQLSEPPSVMQSEPPPVSEASSGIPELTEADEAHFEETYRKFVELRVQTGEPADKVSYEKFAAKLRKNREELLAKHSARGVRFSVYMKDGRAAIKASAIR